MIASTYTSPKQEPKRDESHAFEYNPRPVLRKKAAFDMRILGLAVFLLLASLGTALYHYEATERVATVMLEDVARQVTLHGKDTTAVALDKLGIDILKGDKVSRGLDELLCEGETVFVTRRETVEALAFASVKEYNENLPQAEDQRLKIEVNAEVIASVKANQKKAVSASIYIDSLDHYVIGREVTVTATAYCNCAKCCGSNANGKTANGSIPQQYHTIAASSEYAFGTKVYIPDFKDKSNGGVFEVEDRGGAVNGNKIDIYFSTHEEASRFGTRTFTMYVLE
jgi:3D (Asp-Asp-Asp) domain-containing protein